MSGELLNLAKLRKMIDNGVAGMPKDPNANEAIILIGDTGVGKSTIMAFLSGAEMTVRYDGLKPILDCPRTDIKIGHEKYSQTSIPNKIVIDNLAFYDCPGFKDNKGEEYEISNSFFVQRLLDIYPKVKIVLMIDESHISEARADKLPKLTKNLLKSFKTFDDIREGVVVIINRAERDLSVKDYHKEIKKMLEMRTDRGHLFESEEQKFLHYLIDHNRICIFKQPRKEDKNKKYIAEDTELNIMRTIKTCSFVKSKHILNILSESAKLAIRDFIDDITAKSNNKIELICKEIVTLYQQRMQEAGKNVEGLMNIKEQIYKFSEEIKASERQKIVEVLQRELPQNKIQDFSQDFTAVIFFKSIYDKTSTYFLNIINKISSELSQLLMKMDSKILKVQREEQEQIEREKQVKMRRELNEKREKDRQELIKEMNKMSELRNQIKQMTSSGASMSETLSQTLKSLGKLEQEFIKLRQETNKLQLVNQEMSTNISKLGNATRGSAKNSFLQSRVESSKLFDY